MTTDTPITAAAYADLVRAELTDLPPDDLASMVEGLDAHLAEIAADGPADLVTALGAPTTYAAELRSAAGLPAKARPTFTPPAPPVPAAGRRRVVAAFAARAVVALAVAAAVAAVVMADPTIITIPRSVAVAAGVGVAWWALNWLVGRSDLAPRPLAGGRALIAVAALAAAAILGAELHATHNDGSGGGDVVPLTTYLPGGGHFTETMVQVANCSAQNGVAGMMTSLLGDTGFTMAEPAAGTCDPKLTTSYVIFDEGVPGAADVAATLALLLGVHAEPAVLPIKVEGGAWADGSGVVLLLGNDLAGKTLDQIQGTWFGQPTVSTFPAMSTTSTVVFPTAPPAAQGTLRFTATMPDIDGFAEVRDVAGEVCVYVHVPDGDSFGCFPLDAIESGNAWSATKASSNASTLLTGLAATSIGLHVLVGDDTIMPDANGFWYVVLPPGVTDFTIVTDRAVTPVNVVEYYPLLPPTTTTTAVYNP